MPASVCGTRVFAGVSRVFAAMGVIAMAVNLNRPRWRLMVMTMDRDTTANSIEARLYERFGDDLIRFATSLVGASDAQDVVSRAMVKLIANRALRDASNPQALLFRTAFNEAKSMQRSAFRRRRRERSTARSVLVVDPDLRPEVVHAVLGLSPQQRACIWLTFWADLPVREVAEYLGVSEGTVKQHLSRARARLKEVIDE